MVNGVNKTDKIHLFDDRNLKSLIRLYNWTGQQGQREMRKTKTKKVEEEEVSGDSPDPFRVELDEI